MSESQPCWMPWAKSPTPWRAMPAKCSTPRSTISVPACLRGVQTIMARVRKLALRHHLPLGNYAALVCVDLDARDDAHLGG